MSRVTSPKEISLAARVGLLGFAAVGGFLIVGLIVGWIGLMVLRGSEPTPVRTQPPPPAPRLEVAGGADLAEVRRVGDQRLAAYGWNDAARTTARIPMARAMQLRAAMGWADREAQP